MPGFLQPAQHHNLDQTAHMQRFCRGIKTNIGRCHPAAQSVIEALVIGAIGQKSALHHDGHEF